MNSTGSITSTPANANGNAPTHASPTTPTVAPVLTPEIALAVLRGLARFRRDEELGDIADYELPGRGYGVAAGIEAIAAVERAGTVRPFVDLVFSIPQLAGGEIAQLPLSEHAEPDFGYVFRALRHTVYAVLGGAYSTLDRVEHRAVFDELAEQCEQLLRAASERAVEGTDGWGRAATCLADMTGWLVSAARLLDGPGRDEALSAVGNAASHLARWLLDCEDAGEADVGSAERFIAALRGIGAAGELAAVAVRGAASTSNSNGSPTPAVSASDAPDTVWL